MRIFVTGATGFVGAYVVRELIGAGHTVLGLVRSKDDAKSLIAVGANPVSGSLEDFESLRTGAAASEAVIHLGFENDLSKFKESCELDRRAIETLGSAIAGSDKPLLVPNGIAGLKPGQVATELDEIPEHYPFPRVSEQTAIALVSRGVRASVIRLPQVHDIKKQGFATQAVAVARELGVSAYVGDGLNRWPAAHVSDVGRLFRLVLESPEAGATYHAVAEEGVHFRSIAETIGRVLDVPVRSVTAEAAPAHFGPLAMFVGEDMPASGIATQAKKRWQPDGPSLIADLEQSVKVMAPVR